MKEDMIFVCGRYDKWQEMLKKNRNGLLTGKLHFDGTNLMQQLLESEGVTIVNNQIVDLEKHFWQPEVRVE